MAAPFTLVLAHEPWCYDKAARWLLTLKLVVTERPGPTQRQHVQLAGSNHAVTRLFCRHCSGPARPSWQELIYVETEGKAGRTLGCPLFRLS
jgi:hypothetical protein